MIHTESHSGEREWVESERETSVPGWAWCQAGHTERIPLLRSGLWQFSWLRSRYWRRGHFPSLFRIGQCHAAEFSPFITCNSFVNIDNLNNETSRHCGVLTVSGRWNVGLGASTVAQASAGKVWGPPQEGAGILCGVQCLRPLSHELILQLLLVVYHLLRVREKYSNYVCCILFSFICVAYELLQLRIFLCFINKFIWYCFETTHSCATLLESFEPLRYCTPVSGATFNNGKH